MSTRTILGIRNFVRLTCLSHLHIPTYITPRNTSNGIASRQEIDSCAYSAHNVLTAATQWQCISICRHIVIYRAYVDTPLWMTSRQIKRYSKSHATRLSTSWQPCRDPPVVTTFAMLLQAFGRRPSSALLHPDHARLFRGPLADVASVEDGSCSLAASNSSSTASSLNSIAASYVATSAASSCNRGSVSGSRGRPSEPWVLAGDRRRSSTITARFSLLDALDFDNAIRAARGSIGHYRLAWGAFDSAKNHKRQRRKRQSVTAKREKSQTPKFVQVRLGQVRLS